MNPFDLSSVTDDQLKNLLLNLEDEGWKSLVSQELSLRGRLPRPINTPTGMRKALNENRKAALALAEEVASSDDIYGVKDLPLEMLQKIQRRSKHPDYVEAARMEEMRRLNSLGNNPITSSVTTSPAPTPARPTPPLPPFDLSSVTDDQLKSLLLNLDNEGWKSLVNQELSLRGRLPRPINIAGNPIPGPDPIPRVASVAQPPTGSQITNMTGTTRTSPLNAAQQQLLEARVGVPPQVPDELPPKKMPKFKNLSGGDDLVLNQGTVFTPNNTDDAAGFMQKFTAQYADEINRVKGNWAKLGKAAKAIPGGKYILPGIGILADAGFAAYDAYNKDVDQDKQARTVEAIGAGVGAGGGGLAGAAIGQALIPIPILGALVGGVLGANLGEFAGRTGADLVDRGFGDDGREAILKEKREKQIQDQLDEMAMISNAQREIENRQAIFNQQLNRQALLEQMMMQMFANA